MLLLEEGHEHDSFSHQLIEYSAPGQVKIEFDA
jgi:hypothetical protein